MHLAAHLTALESEAIGIIRQAEKLFESKVLLFSGGKDSMVMLHLASLAYAPYEIPFPIMQIDTGHNFPETQEYIKQVAEKYKVKLLTASVEESIAKGTAVEEYKGASRNRLQSVTLMEAIHSNAFDCVFGGGRRDEEKARAKERVFSHRNEKGVWEAENQMPECWDIVVPKMSKSIVSGHQHYRVFPLSNWTELDVWQYIAQEKIVLPSLYFAAERTLIERAGMWLPFHEYVVPKAEEKPFTTTARFRTLGDITCSGAIASNATTVEAIIEELRHLKISERGGRADDKVAPAAMELRKKQGYF